MKSNEERVKSILEKAKWYKMKKKKEGYALITCLCAVVIAVVAGTSVTPNMNRNNLEKIDSQTEISQIDNTKVAFNDIEEIELTTFNSKKELIKKMKSSDSYKKYQTSKFLESFIIFDDVKGMDMAVNESAVMAPTTTGAIQADSAENLRGESSKEFSETNTQVQGVDESDIVKTNGDFIYYLNNNVLRIFDNKGEKLELIKEIKYNQDGIYEWAQELYIDDDYIVVFVNSSIGVEPRVLEKNRVMYDSYYYGGRSSAKVLIYDINSYELVREIETEGNLISTRKVDDDIYMITNKYIYYSNFNEDEILPLCKDTCEQNGAVLEMPIEAIKCFPSFEENEECSYLIITSFSLDNIKEKANVETFLGTGSEIYCSRENLYVTKVKYNYETRLFDNVVSSDDTTETIIRKFAIHDGDIKYIAEGKVPGTPVNQFAMDEYDGNFRITTTKGYTWDDTSENNLYVLNEKLEVIGELEGLAKGEKIYSTRFMGDKCYVVTFKTVDPLFVLDLSDPENPTVLGELKIPGYSKYLHPLGENYLIGFGEDAIEKKYKNYDGTEGVTAYATGLKLAIFDVTDLENPKELDSVKIGGRGSYSELLYNHKSLLFKEDEGIFAFPATLAEEAGYYEDGTPKYGKTEFEGVLVFDLSIEEGINLRGKISNDENKNYYNNQAKRVIYIEDKLYSIFDSMIKVNDIETIEEVDKIKFN